MDAPMRKAIQEIESGRCYTGFLALWSYFHEGGLSFMGESARPIKMNSELATHILCIVDSKNPAKTNPPKAINRAM